ncbi:type IIG restriction enzyme/methyltransferase [Helicobacter macacae]|uniref:site-specific DNA-methyltransferase (adenine-specific) n=1 Tax=Helicobacter macacae MIT 99-5501 TaxID=1357400 RepID=V8C8A5_9HELI|nr:DNA methyltransferase [Helicobacter macacae]ETD23312.1 hypothetical protein HMPREF2086_01111 [Helicobacter macacae MIT 99-5501]
MLAFRALKLEEINSIYAQEGLEKNELNTFAKVFGEYHTNAQAKLAQISASTTKYSERNIAGNELARFFDALGFQTQIDQESGAQSVNSAIDLALLQNDSVKVIIEAKLPESISKSKQMFSPQNPNCKALHEAILYYLREVVDKQNFSVETIIITDFTRFFIFGYKEFERLFAKNAKIKDIFAKYKNDTSNFYAKAQGILDLLDDEICGVCVDLSNLAGLTKATSTQSTTPAQSTKNKNPSQNATENTAQSPTQNLATSTMQALTPKGKKSLETLCKIFHKDFLFGEFKQSNPLSPRFYNELLYILGLSEYKRSGKILILPSKESLEGANTLYHLIITQLQATHPSEAQNLDFVMQYIILWLNRILFLKLIEANLVRFNDDKALAFLNKSKLKDYQALSHLFFEILAKEHSKRPKDSPLAYLPHLNSSLFERQPCEEVLEISMLDNSAEFSYYATTQVRKEGKRQAGKVNLLSYIFEFLDAFDFGSGESDTSGYNEGEDSRIIEQKELIKTNVLGLVFEKLNGYKEGSFYTPNFITSYMCRISLEQVILERFNEANPKWNATSLAQLAELIRDERERKDEFKAILRGVRICDPSVGSGHFLVSALCEMIRIYHSLRLSDELNEYELKIDDDEIIIDVAKDKVFDYKKPTKPNDNNQAVQKCLFTLKKSIIQNNLFGVDINPNSVEICKLRLWIELLKNSYYLTQASEGFDEHLPENYHQMQTLPNIDINIKCGNSLISRFSLQDSLRHIPNINKQIKDYQKLVLDYKHSNQSELKASKKDIESKIANLKETFKLTLKDPKTKASLEKAIKNHIRDFGMFMLDDESLLDGIGGYTGNLFDDKNLSDEEQKQAAASYANIKYLRHKLDSALSGEEYKNAFEWRFEFPEVLDSNGDFMGFDLIIGNPPYGNLNKLIQKQIIESAFPHSYFGEISSNFAELAHTLIKQRARFSFVTSYALLFSLAQSGLRNLLHSNYKYIQISSYDRDGSPQFDKMSQSVCILFADSKAHKQKAVFRTSNFVRQKIPHEELEFSNVDDLLLIGDELGKDFSQRHRVPKIGSLKNLELLKYLKKLPNKLGNFFGGDECLYIRTSGNYWYNAFLEIPYQSTEIKSFSVSNKYFVFCLINSNVYYWWLRIYGDGRHNNKDIMDSFRLPKMELINKYDDLWKELALSHWNKMKSVFNTQHNFFATSQIKDSVDILDYHICLKVLGFDMKTLTYICDYDSNIRGGLKCDFKKLERKIKDKRRG